MKQIIVYNFFKDNDHYYYIKNDKIYFLSNEMVECFKRQYKMMGWFVFDNGLAVSVSKVKYN